MLPLTFKIADQPAEFQQIHRLNYLTFVDEIPQHDPSPDGILIDRFHDENTYVIALNEDELIGMVCVRGNRPFSLDLKLPNLDDYLPAHRSVCEIRLLAIKKGWRRGLVFPGMMRLMWQTCLARNYDVALISGTTRQLRLYGHLGFEPFGPLVGAAGAQFQPMMLTLERWREKAIEFAVFLTDKPTVNNLG
ncbi:hypothetical protein LLG95_16120 [bacterium]|nr:hypothetical protein [bacterium]